MNRIVRAVSVLTCVLTCVLTVGCSRARIHDTAATGRQDRDSGAFMHHGDKPGVPGEPAAQVVLNELMTNGSVDADWLELINLESGPVDLSGWLLIEDQSSEEAWAFPEGTVLEPGALLVVVADEGMSAATQLSASFKLSSGGEALTLVDPEGILADEVEFPPLDSDTAYARLPDGIGDWAVTLSPTKGTENILDGAED